MEYIFCKMWVYVDCVNEETINEICIRIIIVV